MSVYRIVPDSNTYDALLAASPEDRKRLDALKGKPRGAPWQPARVVLDPVGQPGDFPSLRRELPVFTERAWEALRPLVGPSVEALPLAGTAEPLYAIHVLDVADCLDHSRSKIQWYPSGLLMWVDEYAFKEGYLGDRHLFKLRETAGIEVLASETFRELVESNNLKGLIFQKIA